MYSTCLRFLAASYEKHASSDNQIFELLQDTASFSGPLEE